MNRIKPVQSFPKRILLSVPHMGGAERRYVEEAFSSNWLSTVGPNLNALEEEFSARVGLPSVALSSGTAGIHLGVRLMGVGPGDEVVVPTLTFAGGCNPILYEKAKPVFVDSERESWNMDPQLLAGFLKKRAEKNRLPKAVTVVHIFGQSADMDAILEICRRYELPLLEDAAEAMGTTYKGRPVGVLGDIGVYSLNGNKIITSTGGGLLVSPKKKWVERARFWSTQARDPGLDYLHSELGFNYRMSNVIAGIARGQFEVLEERVNQRRSIAFGYRDGLANVAGISLMPQAAYGRHTNWLSCFLVDEESFGISRNELIAFLNAANVEARPVWKPMHAQKLYAGCEIAGGAVAEDLNARGICLPSSSSLSSEEQQFVIDRIREAAQK
ncbi:MAG: DegT/DnrJ/EryC1/StrS family aminotransferase [Opitutales bacterium]